MVAAEDGEPAVTAVPTTFAKGLFERLRARARRGILLEGAAAAALAFVVFMGVSYAIDRTLRLETAFRAIVLLVFVAALVRVVIGRIVRPLRVSLDDDEMALALERADAGLRQSLISAVQFDRRLGAAVPDAESPELMRHVVGDVGAAIDRLPGGRAFDAQRARRHGALLGACVAAVALWAALSPGTLRLWALRNLALSAQPWPRLTSLAFVGVDGAVLRLPEGDDQTLAVRADGVVPDEVVLHYRFAGGERGVEPMSLTGEREFLCTLPAVLDDVVVWATGGDGSSDELRIELVARPRIEDVRIVLVHPEYMAREPATIGETEGDIRVPRGGRLELAARATKPLREAFVMFGQDQRQPLAVGDDGTGFAGAFTPADSGVLVVDVRDRDDLGAARPTRLVLRVVEDAAPAVELRIEGVGSMVTPFARIPGRLAVRDDYGLRAIDAQFRTSGDALASGDQPAAREETPFEAAPVAGLDAFTGTGAAFEGPVLFDLQPLCPDADPRSERNRFHPEQFLSLKFRARDNFAPGEPHLGESEVMTLRVVTQEKLLEDLARRQTEYRRELEQMRDEIRAHRTEFGEILSPAAADPKAERARLRVLAIARLQRALGRRVNGVGERYTQILDEFENNRILEPGKVADLRARIPAPLARLAAEDFPASVRAVEDFARTGADDVRSVVVSSYETILQQIEAVLAQMTELETFATLLEDLRQIIKVQNSAISDTRKRRDEDAAGVFGPASGDKPKDDGNPRKNK
jgi:hypothetical protein